MSTKKVTELLEQTRPQENGAATNSTDSIVAKLPADVKVIRDLRLKESIPVADLVDVVKAIYPKYDRYLHSKAEHGEEYGIQLRSDAIKALLERFTPEMLVKPRPDKRKKSNRIQARLSDGLYELLQLHLEVTSVTTQDFLEGLVVQFFSTQNSPRG